MVEVWKEAKGFEGYLEVSTKGNVRSIDRVITVHDGTRVYKKRIKGKVKKKQKNSTATRGGCWFCHNQGIDQLRLLRKNYPDLWALMLKWDADSPVSFKPDGHTVHDFERRFQMEDDGIITSDKRFSWKWLNKVQMPIDYYLRGKKDG